MTSLIQPFINFGVIVPDPDRVYIGPEVAPDRIAPGAVLHPGTRIVGAETSIGPDCIIGGETPATVDNCQLEARVELKGGFFQGSVFLDGANVGSGAHIRPGTILEEEASAAHTVGFKQTILFPFTVTGSLINFCDVLLAGGTSRKNHSEVGSSYIHFNFTPRGDKATASLVGDVPNGVLLDQPPIFLGGQGGLVGPARVAYGTIIPAGTIQRGDVDTPGQLVQSAPPPADESPRPFNPRRYGKIRRLIHRNLEYCGQMAALKTWYQTVRLPFMSGNEFHQRAAAGLLKNVDLIYSERIKRLTDVTDRIQVSREELGALSTLSVQQQDALQEQTHWLAHWPEVAIRLREIAEQTVSGGAGDRVLSGLHTGQSCYISAIQSATEETRQTVRDWLQSIVDSHTRLWDSVEA